MENLFPFPLLLADTSEMPIEEWRELRRPYIGGSDAAAVAGISKYAGPISVFYDKVMTMPDKAEGNDRLRQKFRSGHKLEPVIADIFAEETGKTVVRQPYFYRHPEFEFMSANIDFAVIEEDGSLAILECKNSAFRADWKDGLVPDHYFIQTQHYMAVLGVQRCYLAYMLEGWEFNFVVIERDEEMIRYLIELEAKFWYQHVVPGIPPQFDGSDDAKNLINFLYPKENGETIELDESIDQLFAEKAELAEQIGAMDKRVKEIDNQIKAAIGENQCAQTPRAFIRFVTVEVKAKTVEAYSYRRLYRKELKA